MRELIVEEKESPICTITLNRPEKRNALTPEMLEEMVAVLRSLEESGQVRVVIVRGAGKAFSAGFDISRISPKVAKYTSPAGKEYLSPVEYAVLTMEESSFPVIAMVDGYAVGGGLELAVGCDLRLAGDTARFGMPPAKLGIVYRPEPLRRFLDLIGMGYTKELFLTGRLIDAPRALEMGLVNQLFPADRLEEATYSLAREIAENAPLPIKGVKIGLAKLTGFPRLTPEDDAYFTQLRRLSLESEDLREGRKAFQEGRKPRFNGK